MKIKPKLCPLKFCSPYFVYEEGKDTTEGRFCSKDNCAWWIASMGICGIVAGKQNGLEFEDHDQ